MLRGALEETAKNKATQHVLRTVYDKERRGSVKLYGDNLARARRDVTFPEFERKATALAEAILARKPSCHQQVSELPKLTEQGAKLQSRFDGLLQVRWTVACGPWTLALDLGPWNVDSRAVMVCCTATRRSHACLGDACPAQGTVANV